MPRPRTKISSMTDAGAQVTSIFTTTLLATSVAAQFNGVVGVAPATNSFASDAGGAVIRNYQEYKMKRAVLTYTPAIGTTSPGVVYIAYFDNPEIINKWINSTYTAADKLALAKTAPVSVRGPVWMQLELPASMTVRKPRYTVNTEITSLTNADYDNQVHGIFGVVTEGVGFSTSFGLLSMDYSVLGYNLQNFSISGI